MESMLILLIVFLIILNLSIIYFLIRKKEKENSENTTQILKDEINFLKNSFSSSFGDMSKEIAKDMTGALTRVDEKVGVFNKQVEELNKSQESFSRILSGVKQYGVLAEFSLGSLLKDLLPVSQYLENVKMKPEETSDTVEFAVRLQDVLVPIDSHWPIEKFKAIDDAFQKKDKEALKKQNKNYQVGLDKIVLDNKKATDKAIEKRDDAHKKIDKAASKKTVELKNNSKKLDEELKSKYNLKKG